MADFHYFLNRQGIQGRKGDKGETGFSPTITVLEQTPESYKLQITNEYETIETPNLIGSFNATDNGGTYVRYDREAKTMSLGELNSATVDRVGGIKISSDEDIQNMNTDTAITPEKLADALSIYLEAGTDNVSIVQDEATSKTKISVTDSGGSGVSIDDSTTATTSVWSSSKTNTEITTVANEVDNLTNEVNDLSGRVTTNEADIATMKTSLSMKQTKLTAGANITLTDLSDGTVRIDSTGGGGAGDIPIATTTTAGKVKPDGTTITITDDGTISAVGGGSAPANMMTTDTNQTIDRAIVKNFTTNWATRNNGGLYGSFVATGIYIGYSGGSSNSPNIKSKSSRPLYIFSNNDGFTTDKGLEITKDTLRFINSSGAVTDLLAGNIPTVIDGGDSTTV